MALRVLLADESTTIKKVFQLALQDYAVEVTSVAAGLDVLPAARQFKPDIVFCDILLQKKNGYEVCSEFKADATLKSIPVVLMWSGFMELDKDKLEAARADGRLEKPFDVQQLRTLVQKLVPRTQNQRLGQFLKFPQMPEMLESTGGAAPGGAKPSTPPPPPPESQWNMESFDPIPEATTASGADPEEEFREMPLPPPPKSALDDDDDDDSDGPTMSKWSTERLKRFNVKDDERKADQLAVDLNDDDDDDSEGIELPPERDFEIPLEDDEPPVVKGKSASSLNETQIELQVREQARAMIEAVVWKVVPELATQIIEREIKRLLDEKGAPPQP